MFAEDLDAFLNTAEFATAATLNGVTAIKGIFERPYVTAGGFAVGSNPTFTCKESDGVVGGNTLLVDGVTYKVIHPEPDGTGLANLQLEQQ